MATAIDRVIASAGIGDNPRVHIGANNPPSAFEAFATHIADLIDEAKNHLDGGGVSSEAEAASIAKLLDMARTAKKDADAARAAEKKPHDDAAKAIQALWKPLIDRADLAAETCKKALAPWLEAQEAERRAAAEAARLEAEEKAAAARQALQAAAPTDLAAREQAEALVKDAACADRAASKAENSRTQAKGGDRAVGLRSVWTAYLADSLVALRHYRLNQPEALKVWLCEQAQKDVRAGKREIPGFTVTETKVAV